MGATSEIASTTATTPGETTNSQEPLFDLSLIEKEQEHCSQSPDKKAQHEESIRSHCEEDDTVPPLESVTAYEITCDDDSSVSTVGSVMNWAAFPHRLQLTRVGVRPELPLT